MRTRLLWLCLNSVIGIRSFGDWINLRFMKWEFYFREQLGQFD